MIRALLSSGERLKTSSCSPASSKKYVSTSSTNFSTKGTL
ncbi:unnamed protein product [Schistosoma mattheei]|uniref:Uncharacterized protein n=1 Tax=Schistosoma mattheei TaxID=31246 RepID=A0A183NQ37_9TREM|nr:unnamed protein product [Schistosoma mattheei]